MRIKLIVAAAAASLAMSAFGVSGASAATEFGDNCVASGSTETSEPVTLFALTAAGDPLSLTAPSTGVITQWRVTSAIPTVVPQTFRVLRQNGPATVLIVGETPTSVAPGTNTVSARIPVQAGDRLGLLGTSPLGILYCVAPGPMNAYAGFVGGGVGQTVPVISGLTAEARFPVAALIEPDADNDGFGDETQDQCPQLASVQTTCPPVVVDARANKARKGSVTVLVTTTSQAPVTVTGTAKLGKGKTAKLKGGTQVVVPGTIAKFTLFFPKRLREKLKDLSTKQSLNLSVSATATDLIGRITSDSLKVKLKGQEKPEPKRRLR